MYIVERLGKFYIVDEKSEQVGPFNNTLDAISYSNSKKFNSSNAEKDKV